MILTKFGSFCRNFRDIFQSRRLCGTTDGLGLQWNGHSKTFWRLTFELLDRNIAPLYFNTERVAETALRGSWFWQTSGEFSGAWGIFSSPLDAKLMPDGLVFRWNGHSKTFLTLTFELVGWNIAPLHFKTETVADTALRESWFWSTSARVPANWKIFSTPGDSKLTPEGLDLQLNGHSKTFWTLTFELLVQNIAPLHFKTERVAKTPLRASWFWQPLSPFFGTYRIFSSPWDPKLTSACLCSQWNWHRKTFWTVTFELLGRNIPPLHFKTERLAEIALRA